MYYDNILEKDVFLKIGEAKNCAAGTFSIIDGVLSDTVTVTPVAPLFGKYYEIYQCDSRGDSNWWVRQYWSKETEEYAIEEECAFNEIPENAEIMIWNTATPVVFNHDLAWINVRCGDVTINGDIVAVEDSYNTSGELQIHPRLKGKCKVVLDGDVDTIYIDDLYNTEYNVTITGKCSNGNYSKGNNMGYFNCDNVQLVKNGVWNKDVFINAGWGDSGIAYSAIAS